MSERDSSHEPGKALFEIGFVKVNLYESQCDSLILAI
jgi:hypothetical protein